jgi:hypothetical protein
MRGLFWALQLIELSKCRHDLIEPIRKFACGRQRIGRSAGIRSPGRKNRPTFADGQQFVRDHVFGPRIEAASADRPPTPNRTGVTTLASFIGSSPSRSGKCQLMEILRGIASSALGSVIDNTPSFMSAPILS